ncbi:MAG: polyphosphate kinase 1 [Anaeromyxobacter sp.]|nr:polyphosphate kinase 1 [Anaeromyxobacter sp.]
MSPILPSSVPADAEKRQAETPDPALFLNRELSWLAFNERVLEEAQDPSLPLLERVKFLGIVSSNLDEFFMVRVAGMKKQLANQVAKISVDGLLPAEALEAVSAKAHALIDRQCATWRDDLLPRLAEAGLFLPAPKDFTPDQVAAARAHFNAQIRPALTPLAVDQGHPFPQLKNKSLNVALLLRRGGRRKTKGAEELLAVVQVPAVLPRLVKLPSAAGLAHGLLDEIIADHAGELFPGFAVVHRAIFRVTRNWDLDIDDEESEDLLSTVQDELRKRDRGAAVRLEVGAGAPDVLVARLTDELTLGPSDVYPVTGPLEMQDVAALADADLRPELRVPPHAPVVPPAFDEETPVIEAVARGDQLLHHPYESFDPVVRFIEEAADDPDVIAIKQTMYRTGGDSPFVRALSHAAEEGKQVTALVELKARFDEDRNIRWARKLADSGVHVVYGVPGLKTHCKMALVVRREGGRLRRYVHLGTGNYNPQTARGYTDLSLFSVDSGLCEDVADLFDVLTGYAEPPRWNKLVVAPGDMQDRILRLIDRERAKAERGEPCRIVAKMNALVDPPVIRALYAASRAGVEIDLLIRGICCLKPGVPGLSERIRVVSVVDRFLEHSRVFAFGVGPEAQCFLSSADWMPRNFNTRVEVMFPVEAPELKARLVDEVLGLALKDTARARRLQADGRYLRDPPAPGMVRSQQELVELATRGRPAPGPPALRVAPPPERPDQGAAARPPPPRPPPGPPRRPAPA